MSPSVSIRLLLTQSDARLVALAGDGHERAFEALVQRYRRPLLRYCRRLLLPNERAEDALQQALLQAWLALQRGVEVNDVRAWLYRIVHNTALNTLRMSGYDYCTLSESLSGAGAPQDDLDRRIAVREALAGLATLPQMQREALLRTAVEGATHAQAARDLGVSENALRGLVYRARATLRTAVTAATPPPLLGWVVSSSARSAPFAERLAGAGGGGGAAGLTGFLLKGGAVVVTAGTLATGVGGDHGHKPVDKTRDQSSSIRLVSADATGSPMPTSADGFPATAQRRTPATHGSREPARTGSSTVERGFGADRHATGSKQAPVTRSIATSPESAGPTHAEDHPKHDGGDRSNALFQIPSHDQQPDDSASPTSDRSGESSGSDGSGQTSDAGLNQGAVSSPGSDTGNSGPNATSGGDGGSSTSSGQSESFSSGGDGETFPQTTTTTTESGSGDEGHVDVSGSEGSQSPGGGEASAGTESK